MSQQPGAMGQALLVVSDREIMQVTRSAVENEGYDVVPCVEAEHASSILCQMTPAIVILDAADGVEASLELCRSLRKLANCDYTPMILLSDDDSAEARSSAYDASITTVFAKPLDANALRRHVQSLGDTGRTLSGVRALRMPQSEIFRTFPDAFFIVGDDGLLRQHIGGGDKDEVLCPVDIEGHMIEDVWPQEVADEAIRGIKRVLRTRDGHSFEFELEKDGDTSQYEARLLVQGRDRVMLIVRNISESRPSVGTGGARDLSDTLTGLTARDVFLSEFDTLVADASLRERGIATLCIDIDRFTQINETLGRAVGDAVLQVTAKRIERCLRSSDQLARIDDSGNTSLSRISGDEFVLVLADIESREDVDTVANRVQEAFSEPVAFEEHKLHVTPSIGISMYPLDGSTAEELLKNARVALDEAKHLSAYGREFYSNTMKFRSLKRFDVKEELRWAIDNEQLELRYLPRIDLGTGDVAGLEALLRWVHPLRGTVPLSEVIPLAEATGLIFPIGEWVLNTACTQARAWQENELEIPPVSVNLSQKEFTREDLVAVVKRALKSSGLEPSFLELELTEGMLMRNRQAATMLRDLEKIGIGLVVDDFGQGHSSVVNLSDYPIKAIKIDRNFVEGVMEPGKHQSICAAIIAMSRELGLSVIAEGVESELQVQFLQERGCDEVQGFLYTEPLPAADVPAFLDACREVLDETSVIDLDTVRHQIAVRTGG